MADDVCSDGDKVTNAVTSKAAAGFRSTLLSVECLQVLSHYEGESLGERALSQEVIISKLSEVLIMHPEFV